jgi:hypothetical protein
MDNAKHISGIWALAVALGVAAAVANTPAVAWGAPAGTGSSTGGSSPSGSARDSSSTSSEMPAVRSTSLATNDPPSRQRRPLNPPGEMAVSRSGGALTSSTAANTVGAPGEVATGGPRTSTTSVSSGAPPVTAALVPQTSISSTGWASMIATSRTPGTDARHTGEVTSRPGFTSAKTSPTPAAVIAPAADPTGPERSRDATGVVAAGVSSFASTAPSAAATRIAAITATSAAAAAIVPPPSAFMNITPAPTDSVSRLVSTLINAALSPLVNGAPTTPVQPPTLWTLVAFARREFEPSVSIPSKTVNPLAGQVTNALVTDPVGGMSEDTSPASDTDFISSTTNFGLFSITAAADPDDNEFVAVVLSTPFFTDILTSGADPSDHLGFGAAGTGVAGETVNTFESPVFPFLDSTFAIRVTDPFAALFTALVPFGF